jgi:hypothetical protein
LCGFCKCSHIYEYAALSKTPHALADGLMLAFQHPATAGLARRRDGLPGQPLHGARRQAFWLVQATKNDGLAKSQFTDDFVKSSKFKARDLTTTRRAGGLDFRPAAEKTKALQCLQRYVCESK